MMKADAGDFGPYVRHVVDAVPMMLAYWDHELRCRFANRAYQTWFGVDPAQLVGSTLPQLLGPDLYALNRPYIEGALRGDQQHFERVVPGPDGVDRHSLASYLPDVIDGRVLGFSVTVTEVTQLKHTEARLRESIRTLEAEVQRRRTVEQSLLETQQALAITLATIDAGLIATDRTGRVTQMNAVSERLTGWTQQDALGRPLFDVFVREDRPEEHLRRNPVELMQELHVTTDDAYQVVGVSRDGARRSLEVKAALLFDASRQVQGLTMVMRDLAPRLKAELESSRLAAIVESSNDAIISKTLDGRITSWNDAAQALFGYSADEIIGQHVQLLIPDDRLHEEMRILATLAQGVHVPPFETLRRARDGSLREVSITISPIRVASGRVAGASKIVRDISARNRAELMRRRAEQLEAEKRQVQEASRLKSQFLANMSHELRTPLNAIIGFADLLRAGKVPTHEPRHQKFLGHIASSGRHLLQLINDVLDLSKVESGKFSFYPEPVNLLVLVQEVCEILQRGLQQKKLALNIDIDVRLTGLQLDPGRLKQVLYNYLSNAIKFTPDGGCIAVRARAVGPEHFHLEVKDSGIGIQAEQLTLLFNEFQQLDSGPSRRYQGSGLGLALTRQLVEAQGGRVGVASSPGAGSTFFVLLNRIHGTDMRRSEQVTADPSRRVLVIEEDPWTHSSIVAGLVDAGLDVSAVTNAITASRVELQSRFDAMTLGLKLADQDGLGLLSGIRSEGLNRQAPVIGMTLRTTGDQTASFAIADILSKPIRIGELAAAIARLPGLPAGSPRVMVVDDDPIALELMRAALTTLGAEVTCLTDARLALQQLDVLQPQALILDLMMPEFDGFAMLDALHRLPRWRGLPVYIWTAMLLTDEEYSSLMQSAQAVLVKGGGGLSAMLERLRHWRPEPLPEQPKA